MSDHQDEMILHFVQQTVDGLLSRCDRLGFVCEIEITVRQKDGTRIVFLEGHGKHEVDGD